MALYKGNVKLAGVGKGFSPENSGTEGQVLTKTETGYAYEDLPSGGVEITELYLRHHSFTAKATRGYNTTVDTSYTMTKDGYIDMNYLAYNCGCKIEVAGVIFTVGGGGGGGTGNFMPGQYVRAFAGDVVKRKGYIGNNGQCVIYEQND